MEEHRCQELRPKSTIILDNTRFDLKKEVKRIANYNGHKVFAFLTKNPCLAAKGTTTDSIIKSYGLFLDGYTLLL